MGDLDIADRVFLLGELFFRQDAVRAGLTGPRFGSRHDQFELQLARLDKLVREGEPIDCIFLGNSMVWLGVDPLVVDRVFEHRTGREIHCFNFGVSALPASSAGQIAPMLVEKYHPKLLIYGTFARDYAIPADAEDAYAVSDTPWLKYRVGDFNLEGWLYNHSTVFQYKEHIRDFLFMHYLEDVFVQEDAPPYKACGLDPKYDIRIDVRTPPDFEALDNRDPVKWLTAADLFEIEKTVQSLDGKLPNLNTAFITISLYSFSRDNAELESLNSRRIRFYSTVPVTTPIQGDFPNFLMGKLEAYTHVMSVVRSDSWKGVWIGLLTDTPPMDAFPYDEVHTSSVWGECFHYTAEQLDPHALHVAGRNVSNSIQMANAHPGLEQDSFDALARTIERLQSRGIRVVLYTPAYHEKYNLIFAEGGSDIIDHMRLAVGKLQQTYEVEYYDFSDDPELTTHPELFYNSDHLSDCGRRVMSAKLLELINENSQLDK